MVTQALDEIVSPRLRSRVVKMLKVHAYARVCKLGLKREVL